MNFQFSIKKHMDSSTLISEASENVFPFCFSFSACFFCNMYILTARKFYICDFGSAYFGALMAIDDFYYVFCDTDHVIKPMAAITNTNNLR